jgi:hypothetical protein
VGTTVFATLQKQVNLWVQLAVGAVSVLAAVLAALQTFLRYSERAEKHRATAAAYAAVRHRLEETTNIPVAVRGPLKKFLDEIEGQMGSLAQSAPNVPESVWKEVQAARSAPHFGIELPPVGMREGPKVGEALTAVKVGDISVATGGKVEAATPDEPYRP